MPDDQQQQPETKNLVYKDSIELNGATLDEILVDEIEVQCTWALDDAERLMREHRTTYKEFLRLPRAGRNKKLRTLRDGVTERVDLALSLAVDFLRVKLRKRDEAEHGSVGLTHAEYFSDLAPIGVRAKALQGSLENSLRKLDDDED